MQRDAQSHRQLALTGAGLEFALVVIIWAALGYWADHHFQTLPLFLLLGCVIGLASGLWRLCRAAQNVSEQTCERK